MQRCTNYLLRLPILFYLLIKIRPTVLEVIVIINLHNDLDIVQPIIRKNRLRTRLDLPGATLWNAPAVTIFSTNEHDNFSYYGSDSASAPGVAKLNIIFACTNAHSPVPLEWCVARCWACIIGRSRVVAAWVHATLAHCRESDA